MFTSLQPVCIFSIFSSQSQNLMYIKKPYWNIAVKNSWKTLPQSTWGFMYLKQKKLDLLLRAVDELIFIGSFPTCPYTLVLPEDFSVIIKFLKRQKKCLDLKTIKYQKRLSGSRFDPEAHKLWWETTDQRTGGGVALFPKKTTWTPEEVWFTNRQTVFVRSNQLIGQKGSGPCPLLDMRKRL